MKEFAAAVAIALSLALTAGSAAGQSAESAAEEHEGIVRDIQVVGNQRIETETVIQFMAVQVGQPYNDQLIDLSLKSLFSTGLFADVTIREESDLIIVTVVENPIINRVAFEGNYKMSQEDLEKEAQLKPRMVLTRAKVQADVQRLIDLYRRSGRFAASVEPKIVQLPQNRVDLVYEISEGEVTGVNRISFIGNKVFSDSELKDEIATEESSWWNILSTSDNYDPDRLTFDREQLRRFYLIHGYADFRVVSAVAELAPDRSGFYITFTVEEGEQYTFGTVDVESEIPDLPNDMLRKVLLPQSGEVYNAELIDKTIDALTFFAGTRGYAFAEVKPRIERDREKRVINIVFQIEQGPRVYVERINIVGNTRTLDRVIRREVRLVEGDAFNRVLVDRSRARLRALGYFKKVEITQAPGGAPDRTILNVEVEEQSTGELSLGFGYSSSDDFIGDLSIQERNLLGKGQYLRFRISASNQRQQADIRFTEPYFMDRNLTVGFDIFKIFAQYPESSFETDAMGLGLRAGFPLSEYSRMNLRYTIRQDDFKPLLGASPSVMALDGDFITSVIGYTYSYNDIDDPLKPTNGLTFTFAQDFAGVGGDIEYYRTTVDTTYYHRVFFDDVIGSAGLSAGWVDNYEGDGVRINDRFFKGGSTFRGFENSGVGPRDVLSSGKDAVGGQLYAIGTVELEFPNALPEDMGIRTALFTDFGTLGLVENKPACTATSCIEDDLAFRLSAGLSVLWDSPFGPVRIDIGRALIKEDYDRTQDIRFSAGTRF